MSKTICLFLLAVFLVMGVFYSYYGRIFLDAGFYLNASREVYQGRLPYRDFFFVQGPVYPYVYGLPLKMTGFHLLYARWLSLVFGMLTLGFTAIIASRSGGKTGSIIALAAIATVPSQAYFFCSVKLYALTAFFITGAFAVLGSRRSPAIRFTFGLIMALLAAATRLTMIPALLIIMLYIILESHRIGLRFPWIPLLVVTSVGLAISIPFLIIAREEVYYFLLGIHTSASEGPYLFNFFKQMKVLGKLILYYPILTMSFGFIISKSILQRMRSGLGFLEWTIVAVILVVTAVHLTANWFSLGYQSVIIPLMAAFSGGLAGRCIDGNRISRPVITVSLLLIAGVGISTGGQYIWMNSVSVIRNLNFITEVIEKKSAPGTSVAACSAVFALEAGRPVADSFGGAPFTYTPSWDDEQCRRFGGVNNRILLDLLSRQEPGVLILEKDSFSVGSPGFFPVPDELQNEIFDAIDNNYTPVATFRNLGNGDLDLTMYIPSVSGVKQ